MLPNLSDRSLLQIGVVLCFVAAWFTIGYHNPDEHTQIWEFANYKLGQVPSSLLSWEFDAKMRPGLQPFLAYCTVIGSKTIGIDSPFVQTFLMRLLSGMAALLVYWKWTQWLERNGSDAGTIRLMRLGLLFFWLMPYLNVRFTSENLAGLSFFGGLLLLLRETEGQKGKYSFPMVLAGLLLGLSFFFRYQIAFAGMGLGAWLIYYRRLNASAWAALFSGALGAIAIGILTDFWLYGEWVFAPYNYYLYNIVKGKAAEFGVWPFWWYFTEMPVALVPPLSLFLAVFFLLGLWRLRSHPLAWCIIAFVLAHSAIAHKEVRFMYPMALPFFFFSANGWLLAEAKVLATNWLKKPLVFCLWLNLVLLTLRIMIPAKEIVSYARFLWEWNVKHPESTVYFVKPEPQNHYTLPITFYENKAQRQLDWYTGTAFKNDTAALRPGDLMVFTKPPEQPAPAPPGFRLAFEYSYYPEWLLKININNWKSRTHIWEIYRLEKTD